MPDNNGMMTPEEFTAHEADWGWDADGQRRSPHPNPEVDLLKLKFFGAIGLFILVVAFVAALVTGEWTLETLEVSAMGVVVIGVLLFIGILFIAALVGLVWSILKTLWAFLKLVGVVLGWVFRRKTLEDVYEDLFWFLEGREVGLGMAAFVFVPGTLLHLAIAVFEGLRPESWMFWDISSWMGCLCLGMIGAAVLFIPLMVLWSVLKGIASLWNLSHS